MVLPFDIVLTLLAAAVCVPVAMFCLEVLLALLPTHRKELAGLPSSARVAVLIPTHNEQPVIGATSLSNSRSIWPFC